MKLQWYVVIIVIISFILSLNVFRILPMNETSLFITVLGLIYGLIAAFTINNAWERFSKIRDGVAEEISSHMIMVKIMGLLVKKKEILAEYYKLIKDYCDEAVDTDWHKYWANESCHRKFKKIFDIICAINPKTQKEMILYDKLIEEYREASGARTSQLVLAQSRVSKAHWALLLFLSLVLVLSAVFLSLPIGVLSIVISSAMLISIGLILVVIWDLDGMKLAEEEVSIAPYKEIIKMLPQ